MWGWHGVLNFSTPNHASHFNITTFYFAPQRISDIAVSQNGSQISRYRRRDRRSHGVPRTMPDLYCIDWGAECLIGAGPPKLDAVVYLPATVLRSALGCKSVVQVIVLLNITYYFDSNWQHIRWSGKFPTFFVKMWIQLIKSDKHIFDNCQTCRIDLPAFILSIGNIRQK